jgi:beta-lactamase regulating signal transducer with metallopeptidase domain
MSTFVYVTGWTLVHVAWQGALVGALAWVALWLCREARAQTRYVLACTALAALLAAPLATARTIATAARVDQHAADGDAAGTAAAAATSAGNGSAPLAGDGHAAAHARPAIDAALPVLVAAWLAGVTILLGRLAGGGWRVRSLHRAALAAAPSRWQAAGARVAAGLSVRPPPHVVDSLLVQTPTVVGWLRPVILLPIAALNNLTLPQVEAILAHEIAHVRRHDSLVNLAQTVAETLLFYHPAAWWLSHRIRVEREHCCDDVAVQACGDPAGYAEALLELETSRAPTPLALGAAGGPLAARVRRLLGPAPPSRRPRVPLLAALAAVGMAMAGIAGGHRAIGAQVPPVPGDAGLRALAGEWQRMETGHFDILYTPDIAAGRERVARAAQRSYAAVSAALRHDLGPTRVTLVLVATRAMRDQVLASGLARPSPAPQIPVALDTADLEADLRYELAHVFGAELLNRADLPRWMTEGLARHLRGDWDDDARAALALAVRTRAIPPLSTLEATHFPRDLFVHDLLAHAGYDFIDAHWGQEGVRSFIFALRALGAVGGPYDRAFGTTAGAFDRAFEAYLADRVAQPAGVNAAERAAQAAARLPPGAIARAPCSGSPLYPPAALPPAGSPPFIWIVDLCFARQRGLMTADLSTYLSTMQLRPSRPSAGEFIPWDETAEQRASADRQALVEREGLLEDMDIHVDEHEFPGGAVGVIVTYDMLERERR